MHRDASTLEVRAKLADVGLDGVGGRSYQISICYMFIHAGQHVVDVSQADIVYSKMANNGFAALSIVLHIQSFRAFLCVHRYYYSY